MMSEPSELRLRLHAITPRRDEQPDWTDVLARAEIKSAPMIGEVSAPPNRPTELVDHGREKLVRKRLLLVKKRRVAVLVALALTVITPVVAVGAANDWWFLRSNRVPAPVRDANATVVAEGQWGGRGWKLVTYLSKTDGLCLSMMPQDAVVNGKGASMSCAPFVGVPRTPNTKHTPDLRITYLSASATAKLPAYIVGAVIDGATQVDIGFADGRVLRVPTSIGPPPLQHVRFYATPLAASSSGSQDPGVSLRPAWLAGVGGNHQIVTCLVLPPSGELNPSVSPCR